MFKQLSTLRALQILGLAGALTGPLLVQAADAEHGSQVFQEECSDCHSVTPGHNKKGPSLAGVVGRDRGSVPDYKYSDALKALGGVWTADQIDAYITDPGKVVPDGKMGKKYKGLKDSQARADLIEFLTTKQ